MTRFIRFILGHRVLFGTALLLSIGLALYSARSIRVRFQFRDFYDYPSNPEMPLFRQDNLEFGDPGGYVVALVESSDVFDRDVLEYVRTLTTELAPHGIFVRVRSLTSENAIRGQGEEVMSGPLLPYGGSESAAELLEKKNFAIRDPLLRRRLISADGKVTAVLAEMRTPAAFATIAEQREALEVVKKAVSHNRAPNGVRVRVTGAPALEVGVTGALVKDLRVLVPLVVLVLAVTLFLTFRSFQSILLCLATVSAATTWTAGLFALLNRPVDIIGAIIPIAILVYGIVDPIFVLTRVLQKLETDIGMAEAIVAAFSELAMPCFLTSLTTALGFVVFVGATSLSIRYFGLTVAAGVLLAWLASVTVLPLLLVLTPRPQRRPAGMARARRLDGALSALWDHSRGHAKKILLVTGILLFVGAWFARRQHLDNVYVDALPVGQARSDVRALERELSGVLRVIVYLDGPVDSMQQPGVLKAIERVEAVMIREPLLTHCSALADLVADANQAFQAGDPAEHHVPASAALTAQYLALIDPVDRADFVTDDYSKAHIDILLRDEGSETTRAFVARLRGVVENAGFKTLGVKARLTGNGVVGYDQLDSVVKQVVYGFAVAFAAIVILEWVIFRSLRIALISIIPNLVPVVACFITLRAFDIHLKIESALTLCISIGGLFNTTIHLVARAVQRVREFGGSPDDVLGHAVRAIGPAALFTAISLSTGFAVLLFSTFPGLRELGLLSMITLLTGFVSDMVITPALLRVGLNWDALELAHGVTARGGIVNWAEGPSVE